MNPAGFEFTGMMIFLMVVLGVLGITSFVCWIIAEVKIFRESVGLGILGLFISLFAFVYAWIKNKEYDIKGVMILWTITMILSIIATIAFMVVMFEYLPHDLKLPQQ